MTDSIQAIHESGLKSSQDQSINKEKIDENGGANDQQSGEGYGAIVAAHYNTLEERGLDERNKSRIVHLRNFNNWIKSMLIDEYLTKVKEGKSYGYLVRVLDMCCGKGGDLFKWRKGNISHLICADLAGTSVEQCRTRYDDLKENAKKDRNGYKLFTAEFITADCTKMRLREQYSDASLQLDLVSCQFAFHYCFESLAQAEQMLRNAAECLKPGGYFIGTIPNANEIVARHKAAGYQSFGNEVFNITLDDNTIEQFPLFGGKYNFHLEGVVDCPEFLVHFPTLMRLALKFGLELVVKERFQDFFERHKNKGKYLLTKMQALETYPPNERSILQGEPSDYDHADEFIKSSGSKTVGTLSQPEWEAASLYMVFVFRKMKTTWNSEGKPVFESPKPSTQ